MVKVEPYRHNVGTHDRCGTVIDPLLCVGVQGLPWSKGLLVELGFFVPAGLVLWVVAGRLSTEAGRMVAPAEDPTWPARSNPRLGSR